MRRRAFLLTATAAVVPVGCARDDPESPAIVRDPPAGDPVDPTRLARPEPDPDGTAGGDPPDDDPPDDDPLDLDPADYPDSASEWGVDVTGVRARLDTDDPVVALTFDACGGANGSGYDEELIDFLLAESVAATLFVNRRWVDANEDVFLRLAAEPLFEVANHGTEHRPLTVSGRSAYGMTGTADPAAVIDEVMLNQETVTALTGSPPRYFRSGTAHYDEVAVRIVNDLGLVVAGFDVLGDAGATFSATQVVAALETATAGSVALLHMNQPASGTAAGVRTAVPILRDRGLSFARLSDYGMV